MIAVLVGNPCRPDLFVADCSLAIQILVSRRAKG